MMEMRKGSIIVYDSNFKEPKGKSNRHRNPAQGVRRLTPIKK